MNAFNNRLKPKDRTAGLLEIALQQAEKLGLANLRRIDVATAASVSEALVSARLGTMVNLRRDVMRHAIKTKNLRVLGEGVACRDPVALKAPPDLRQQALASLAQ